MKQNIGPEYNRSFFRYVLIAVIIFLITNHDFIFRKKEQVIEWQDEALGYVIKYNMGIPENADVSVHQANTFKVYTKYGFPGNPALILEGKNIKRLDDLQYFISLDSLTIRNTGVTDFRPLESMDELMWLSIDGCEEANLEAIGRLKELVGLKLKNMPDAVIPLLEDLTSLEYLSLDGMSLDSISSMGWLARLSNLELKNTDVKKTSGLSMYWSLYSLKLEHCPIEVLPKLSGSLNNLELRSTYVRDLSILPSGIRCVEIGNNDIEFQTLNGLDKLSDLRIYASDLGDTGKVIYFPELVSLTVSNCNLEKFDFVKGPVLRDLDLSGNKLKNINEIQNLETVINLNLSYNEISDLKDWKEPKI